MTRRLLAEAVLERLRFRRSSTSRSANCLALLPVKRLRDFTDDHVTPLIDRELSLPFPRKCVPLTIACGGASPFEEAPHLANESASHSQTSKLACLSDARSAADCNLAFSSCQVPSRTRNRISR
jgi:hypothetical protein